MQDINPSQTYPQRGTAPGSTQAPTDGLDAVQASSVIPADQDSVNGLAYLAALTLGPGKAPPAAQPPVIAPSYSGSGVARVQTLPTATPQNLVYFFAGDGDVAEVPGWPQYQFVGPLNVTQWVTGHTYTTGDRVFGTSGGSGLQYVLVGSGGTAGAGPLQGQGVVSDGSLTWASLTDAGNLTTHINASSSSHAANVDVVYGQYCTNAGRTFMCVQAGHTNPANTPPTGTGQNQVDGTAKWSNVLYVGQWVMQGVEQFFGQPGGPPVTDSNGNLTVNAFESSGSGSSWTATTNSMTTVTNLSVTNFNCNGNPLVLKVVADGTNGYPSETSQWEIVSSSGGAEAFFQIIMDGSTVIWAGRTGVQFSSNIANFSVYRAPPSVVDCLIIDSPPTGTHSFAVQATFVGVDASSLTAINLKFVGYNL